jgi:hypothetical protein
LGAVTALIFRDGVSVVSPGFADGEGALVDGAGLGDVEGVVSVGGKVAPGVSVGVAPGLGLTTGSAAAAKRTFPFPFPPGSPAARGFDEPPTVVVVLVPGSTNSTRRPAGSVLPIPVTRTSTPLDGPTHNPLVPPRRPSAEASRESGTSTASASIDRQADQLPDVAPRERNLTVPRNSERGFSQVTPIRLKGAVVVAGRPRTFFSAEPPGRSRRA